MPRSATSSLIVLTFFDELRIDSILSLSVDRDNESKYCVPDCCCDDDDLLPSWVSIPFEPFLRPRFLPVAGGCGCSFAIVVSVGTVTFISLYVDVVDTSPYADIVDGALYTDDAMADCSLNVFSRVAGTFWCQKFWSSDDPIEVRFRMAGNDIFVGLELRLG